MSRVDFYYLGCHADCLIFVRTTADSPSDGDLAEVSARIFSAVHTARPELPGYTDSKLLPNAIIYHLTSTQVRPLSVCSVIGEGADFDAAGHLEILQTRMSAEPPASKKGLVLSVIPEDGKPGDRVWVIETPSIPATTLQLTAADFAPQITIRVSPS